MSKMYRKIFKAFFKTVFALVAAALLAVLATSVSAVYDFEAPKPFGGPDIFNPYEQSDTAHCWKRANFHTHTKVEGIFNECDYWPAEVEQAYKKLGYDIVTFSNHNELTVHPTDSTLQVNVYEHGYNLMKYHKLVFGCKDEQRFDHLLPVFAFQRQFQMDLLGEDADFIVLNHPLRTPGSSKSVMQKLGGYKLIELDSGKSKENEYWDWALSAGHYCFGLANDDLHYPDRSNRIAVRCNFLSCPSGEYEDIKRTLLSGAFYAMRVPDYGRGDWEEKYARNKQVPAVDAIGLRQDTIFIALSAPADSIKFTGQDHKKLLLALNADTAAYVLPAGEPYARITAYFPAGEVIYTNPFARYDAAKADSPFRPAPAVNLPLSILYNLSLLILCVAIVILTRRILSR